MSAPWVTSTAHWIAAARARESARPDRLFDDPYAGALAGDRGRQIMERSERAGAGENVFLPVRTRFFDDYLTGWLGAVGTQVVMVGAGLDTRAFRLALPDHTHLFELDHPDLLTEKEAGLSRLGAAPRCRRSVVPTDLARPWIDPLQSAGFDPAVRTLWLAEGLLYYLSGSDVDELLRAAAALSPPGSAFAADVVGTGLLSLPGMQAVIRQRRTSGTAPPFCHDDPAALFGAAGWTTVDAVPVGSERANYGRLSGRPETPAAPTMRTHLVMATR